MSYPKWVIRSPEIGAVLCLNEQEEKDLLDVWEQQKRDAEQDVQGLRAQAAALGIAVDKRWGKDRLIQEIGAIPQLAPTDAPANG